MTIDPIGGTSIPKVPETNETPKKKDTQETKKADEEKPAFVVDLSPEAKEAKKLEEAEAVEKKAAEVKKTEDAENITYGKDGKVEEK